MLNFEKLLNYEFSIDTRTMNPGEIFIAIKGENFDGHNFIEKAFQIGASYVIIDNEDFIKDSVIDYNSQIIKVDNTKDFLL